MPEVNPKQPEAMKRFDWKSVYCLRENKWLQTSLKAWCWSWFLSIWSNLLYTGQDHTQRYQVGKWTGRCGTSLIIWDLFLHFQPSIDVNSPPFSLNSSLFLGKRLKFACNGHHKMEGAILHWTTKIGRIIDYSTQHLWYQKRKPVLASSYCTFS